MNALGEGDRDDRPLGRRLVVVGLVAALLVAVVIGSWWAYNSVTCELRWPDHENEWRPWSGCQVVTSQGRVPEERFRVTD